MSRDPVRLLDGPDTAAGLRQDLAHVVKEDLPYDAAAGLVRLRATMEAWTPPTGAEGAASGSGSVGSVAWAGWWGIGGVGLAGVLLAAAWSAMPAAPKHGEATRGDPRPALAERTEPERPSPAVPLAAAPPVAASPAVAEDPLARRQSADRRASLGASQRKSPPASPLRDQAFREEVAKLAEARAALPVSPAQALALAEAGHRRFATGLLREEREAIAVLALARLGRDAEATARAQAFLSRYPRGPFGDRIRALLSRTEEAP